MKSRNVKVIDEHNIDRDANIIFGLDYEGSEYVVYWVSRDEESNNVFVSKVVKNLDNTFNLANIEVDTEKESISNIVKELISKAVSDEADKLDSEIVTLSNGNVAKFILVSFNKEQRIDVKKTYITTVKKEVTKVSEKYYDVLSEEVDLFSEPDNAFVQENTDVVFPSVVEEPKEETPIVFEPVMSTPEVSVVSEPEVLPMEEVKEESVVSDDFVAFGEESVTDNVVEPITNGGQFEVSPSVAEESVLLQPEIEVPVLEAPTPELKEEVVVPTVPTPVIPEPVTPSEVKPEVVVPTPIIPVVSEPIVETNVSENQPLVFNASKETNLNAALGEVAKDATIPVENIEVVRDFGEDAPAIPQAPVSPIQTPAATILQPGLNTENSGTAGKAGFANSKFFMVVAIAFFLASCVFLGYEVFNYFQLSK